MAEFWIVALAVSFFKLLLLPSYKSTDFEVHRNWLALTHSLPVDKWYYEDTSEWTLDYPPFFAWLEYCLSQVAQYFDKEMLNVKNLGYASDATVLFQRLSVIITDLVFVYAVKEFCSKFILPFKKRKKDTTVDEIYSEPALVMFILLVCNCGLVIVDHIHFQYNGFLFGILILSIVRMYEEKYLQSAFWFAALLNFKHIYLYISPAYFIYLLRCYCFSLSPDGKFRWLSFSFGRLVKLGIIVISVFALSFGPFIHMEQIFQVVSRLFPIKRGLCHAYWAPNFWALYNFADKILLLVCTRLKLTDVPNSAVMTGGLVQEYKHIILPSISPLVTLVASALSILPAVFSLWFRPKGPQSFVRTIVLCAFGSYMFAWHVHEKAILLIILPLSLLVLDKKKDAQVFLVLSTVGHYSLFPLLFTQAETMTKICLVLLYTFYAFSCLGHIHQFQWKLGALPLLSNTETLYLLGIIPLEVYNSLVHPFLGFSGRFPFLPLMFTSVYCAVGVTYCWLRFYWITLSEKTKVKKQ